MQFTKLFAITISIACICTHSFAQRETVREEVDIILCDVVTKLGVPSVTVVGEQVTPNEWVQLIRDNEGRRITTDPGGVASYGVDHCHRLEPKNFNQTLKAMQPAWF